MELTLALVSREFPEAQESVGGFGKCFKVFCRKYHKKRGIRNLEIQASNGWFRCHDCGWTGWAKDEWFSREVNDFHHLFFERSKSQRERSLQGASNPVRHTGIMWGTSATVPAPGEVVPFASLPDEHPAVEYLRDRNFDIDEIRGFEPVRALYYCTRGQYRIADGLGTTGGRLIFPVYRDLVIQGWQARYIDKVDKDGRIKRVWNGYNWTEFKRDGDGVWGDRYVPKYYTCPGMSRISSLYNFDTAKLHEAIAVVEGPLDQISVGPACVATFGKSIALEQIRIIKNYWSRIFHIRDPEIDTTSRTYTDMMSNMAGLDLYEIGIPGGRDAGETPRTEIWALIAKAIEGRDRIASTTPSLS